MRTKFYRCEICGNVIMKLKDSGITPHCCDAPMTELNEETSEGKEELHMPQGTQYGPEMMRVIVGDDLHPMTPKHYIPFVCLETSDSIVVHHFAHSDQPVWTFRFTGKPQAIYAYCNLHGLWKHVLSTESKPFFA